MPLWWVHQKTGSGATFVWLSHPAKGLMVWGRRQTVAITCRKNLGFRRRTPDNVVVVRRRAQPVSEPADTGRTVPGGVDYISGQDQKWWPAAAGIAAYGSNHAGFTVWLKVIFLLNITR